MENLVKNLRKNRKILVAAAAVLAMILIVIAVLPLVILSVSIAMDPWLRLILIVNGTIEIALVIIISCMMI